MPSDEFDDQTVSASAPVVLTAPTAADAVLKVLTTRTFTGVNSTGVTVIVVANTAVTSIEPGSFTELANVVRLVLSDNQVSNLEPSTFVGLAGLEELSLAGNKISSIASGAFNGLR